MVDHEQLQQLERLAELGRLSASLLHEMSNPLAAALLYLEQSPHHRSTSIRQARHSVLILQRYLEAARQQVRRESTVSGFYTRQQLSQLQRLLIPLARDKRVQLRFKPAANHKVVGDPVKFQQILANLLVNAIDAYETTLLSSSQTIPPDSTTRPVTLSLRAKRHWLIVEVTDHGVGLTSDQLSKIFEPFYSTKSRHGKGLGIGLATVRQYVEQDFGGSVTVTSHPQNGTRFIVRLRLTPQYKS